MDSPAIQGSSAVDDRIRKPADLRHTEPRISAEGHHLAERCVGFPVRTGRRHLSLKRAGAMQPPSTGRYPTQPLHGYAAANRSISLRSQSYLPTGGSRPCNLGRSAETSFLFMGTKYSPDRAPRVDKSIC